MVIYTSYTSFHNERYILEIEGQCSLFDRTFVKLTDKHLQPPLIVMFQNTYTSFSVFRFA